MAKFGKSKFGDTYSNISGDVLKNIIKQSGMVGQTVSGGTTSSSMVQSKPKALKSISEELRQLKTEKAIAEYQTMTPEQRAAKYADDPVLSGRFTNIQDTLAGLYKVQSINNLLPLSTATAAERAAAMKKYNAAAATLTAADQEAYKAFFQLGGTIGGKTTGINYGTGANILDTWLGKTTTTPGMNINMTSASAGASGRGIALAGMNKKTGQMNLSRQQFSRLRKLKGMVSAGTQLSIRQQKALARLRKLKNSPLP